MRLNKLHKTFFYWGVWFLLLVTIVPSCSSNDYSPPEGSPEMADTIAVHILSLGDSYTVGTSVCESCGFPIQLKDSLLISSDPVFDPSVDILATSGWTTSNLLGAINSTDLNEPYDLVTLLIGVNNQFQGQPFAIYDSEFRQLLEESIALAGNDPDNVLVLSIPDYAFTPFGQNWGNPVETSSNIDLYNGFAETVCDDKGVNFINITDISREGLSRTELIAADGLHLSAIAYSEIVKLILPLVRLKLIED
ncbi:SGNH/GDSL hydrolase family protein [Winogradskyella aurantiaca]|uniref:SGNH/GDSL hydrolase family protein n=1 Tax=Winogradskyella aurantiaca TaxID=2219558 RepID=UPI001E51799F|nr:SGNH/GDSL hydrolase family protein [Winogradskyella aurantiaca]